MSKRHLLAAPWLAVLLALAAGGIHWAWEVGDLGQSCGYREGGPLPYFPVRIAFAVLVAGPALLTAARAAFERRSVSSVVGVGLVAAVLAAATFGVAEYAFFVSRGCYL